MKKVKEVKSAKEIVKEIDEIVAGLKKLAISDFTGLVQFYDLLLLDIGQIVKVNRSINIVLGKGLHWIDFYTVIPEGTEFPIHWHNNTEVIYVIKGIYGDKIDTTVEIHSGESITYPFGVVHEPYNMSKKNLHILVRHHVRDVDFDIKDNLKDLMKHRKELKDILFHEKHT